MGCNLSRRRDIHCHIIVPELAGSRGRILPKIVILQRPTDTSAVAARIAQGLAAHYGKDTVELEACEGQPREADRDDVLVVMVGPRWLGPIVDGRAGIHHAGDPIRNRIETALQGGEAILAVTIGGSRLPRPVELPDGLKAFAAQSAIEIGTDRNFSAQMGQLIAAIDRCLKAEPRRDSAGRTPTSRGRTSTGETATAPADVATASPPRPVRPAVAQPADDRAMPEYWMRHVDAERRISPGDAPLIMVSYANEDREWVCDLQAFIDPKLEHLRDRDGEAYRLWQFSDADSGALGDEFPTIIAEKMWRCRVGIVVLSKAYFTSRFCRQIELPFLLWRREHHGLFCVPLRLGALPADRVRLPAYSEPSRSVFIDALVDDRQAALDFATSPHRELNLKQLREKGLESEIENRFDGIARLIVDFLRKRHAAIEG
jgi:hypothetical protein